jgi:hypothetical protein
VYRATTATETPCVYGHNFVFPDAPEMSWLASASEPSNSSAFLLDTCFNSGDSSMAAKQEGERHANPVVARLRKLIDTAVNPASVSFHAGLVNAGYGPKIAIRKSDMEIS